MQNVRRLPSLTALKAFESAGRLGSFRAAADELAVTHAIIGRHIRGLEERLGVKLFERSGRGMVLTLQGKWYLSRVSKSFNELTDATEELDPSNRKKWVRILAAPAFCSRWLTDRIESFVAQVPSIQLSIEPSDDLEAVSHGKAHIGIGYGKVDQFIGHVQTLAVPEVFPVCSVDFLKRFGPCRNLDELAQLPLAHEDGGAWWKEWFRVFNSDFKIQDRITFSNADLAIEAAASGRRIALANALVVKNDLIQGTLVRPVKEATRILGYQLVTRSNQNHPHVSKVMNWLFEEMKKSKDGLDLKSLGYSAYQQSSLTTPPLPPKRKRLKPAGSVKTKPSF